MKKLFLLLCFLCWTVIPAFAVELKFNNSFKPRMTADTDTIFRKRSISAGINYGSDIFFFGRTGPIKYPNVSTDVIYNTKSGLFIYGSGVKVLGYNPLIDEIDLGGGYLFHYTNRLTGTLSYTRFLYNRDAAQVIRSASSNDIDFKNTYNWSVVKPSVTFDYLFGQYVDFFTTINLSKYFETKFGIFDDKDYISFNPTATAYFGTQNFVHKYNIDHPTEYNDDFIAFSGVATPVIPNYNNSKFNLLNYSFKIPIAYNRPHYTLEAAWKYSIPLNVEGQLKNRHEVFFNLTFFYLFY